MARISDLAANNQLMGFLLNTQARMNRYQLQVSSEKISQTYSGIARSSQYLVTLENARAAIGEFKTNNELMDFRLQVTETTMGGMNDVVQEMITTLRNFSVGSNPDKVDIADIQQRAFDSMVAMQSFLNSEADGRYIYSGAKVNTEPVDLGLTNLEDFQDKFDGSAVTYATTRDMHIADFSFAKDTNNENELFIDSDKWLTFRRDDDGIGLTDGKGSIEATSAMFEDVQVGSTINISGTANNNGAYTVESVSSDYTKVYVNSIMFTDERLLDAPVETETVPADLVTEGPVAGASITERDSGTTYTPATSIDFNTGTNTLTADPAGAFAGIAAGDVIEVNGTTNNDGTYVVDSIDGANEVITVRLNDTTITYNDNTDLTAADFGKLTFDPDTNTIVSDTANAFDDIPNASIISIDNSYNHDGLHTVDRISDDGKTIYLRTDGAVTITYGDENTELGDTGDLTFDRSADTITATTTDMFKALAVGDVITVAGTAENNGTYVVKSLSADYKTLTIEPTKLTDEGLSTGDKFYDYSTGTKTVFNASDNTIEVQDSSGTALAGAFSNLLAGDSVTVAGTNVVPDLLNKLVFVQNGGTADDTIQVQTAASAAAPGYFSNVTVGDTITLANTAGTTNDGSYTVNWVSEDGSQIRVDEALPAAGTDTNSITVTGGASFTTQLHLNFADDGGSATTDRIYIRDDVPNDISGVFDDFSVGMTVTIGGGVNAGTYTITAVDDANGYISVNNGGADPGFGGADSDGTTTITASGNDKSYTINTVSSDGSKITVAGSTPVVADQTDADGTKMTANGYSLTTGTRLYINDSTEELKLVEKGTGTKVEDAFDNLRVGQTLTLSGTTSNNSAFTIKSVTADVIKVNEDITTSEGDPSVTLSVYGADGTIDADSYYRGDDRDLVHRLDESRTFKQDLNAIDPAFEKAIRAMGIIAQGVFGTEGGLDQNTDRLDDAMWLLQSAISPNISSTPPYGDEERSNLNEAGTLVGFKRVLIQETTKYHDEFITFSETRISDQENVDMTEAVTRLLDESQALEASYQAMARIQSLTLANFL